LNRFCTAENVFVEKMWIVNKIKIEKLKIKLEKILSMY